MSKSVRKDYVRFFSPGTLTAESTDREIDGWSITAAQEMAHEIVERHGATPYAFQFVRRERGPDDLDSHEADRSPLYYLGGVVETLAEVEARNDPADRILLMNMRGNGYDRIITVTNSYRWTQPFRDGDVRLEWTPRKVTR